MRVAWIVLSTLLLVAGHPAASLAQSGSRVALVIGNSSYPDADASLKEPGPDARAIAEELRRGALGFEVDVLENATRDGMNRALDKLYDKIKNGSVALVFFSGYGIQSSRLNYLIPVDAQIWTEPDVRRDGIDLDKILQEMNSRGAAVKTVILDASRRNPYERRFRPSPAGLAAANAPTGSLIMFSAAPNTVISDSSEQGQLVKALVKEIGAEKTMAEEVFNRTRRAVFLASQGQQVPWFSSSLVSDFQFASKDAPKLASAPAQTKPAETRPAEVKPAETRPSTATTPSTPSDRPSRPATTSNSQTAATTSTSSNVVPEPAKLSSQDAAIINDLSRKLDSNPNDVASLYRRGQIYAKNDDFSKAIRDFDATIRLSPRDAEALNNRCWVRAISGDLNAALQDCDAALRLRPDFADGLDSRGFVKLKIGRPEDAIADYDAALRIQSRKASSLYGRGIARQRSGNNSAGSNDIAAAKAIDPRVAEEFARYGIR